MWNDSCFEMQTDLEAEMFEIYSDRVNERQRRKDVCREHKLVDKFLNKDSDKASMNKNERWVFYLLTNLPSAFILQPIDFTSVISPLLFNAVYILISALILCPP